MRILTENLGWQTQFNQVSELKFIYCEIPTRISELAAKCDKYKIDLVLCFDFETQSRFAASNNPQEVRQYAPWLIPEHDASELENKFKFCHWMQRNGFQSLLPACKELTDFPYILKTGNGKSAEHVYYIEDQQGLNQLSLNPNTSNYIAQEYIPSNKEYAFHFIAIAGRIVKHVCYLHSFEYMTSSKPYVKGSGFFNKIAKHHQLEHKHYKILERLITCSKYTGNGCIDFKLHLDNIYIFEFNTRMGGSLFFLNQQLGDAGDFVAATITALASLNDL